MKVLTVGQAWFLVLPDVSSLTENTNVAILLVIQNNMKTGYNGILKKKVNICLIWNKSFYCQKFSAFARKRMLEGCFQTSLFF